MSLTLGCVSRTCGWTCVASVSTADKMGHRHVLTVGLIQACLKGIKACLLAIVRDFMLQRVEDSLQDYVDNSSFLLLSISCIYGSTQSLFMFINKYKCCFDISS